MTKTKSATIDAVGKIHVASTGSDREPVLVTQDREISLAARISALEGELVSTRQQANLLPLIKKNTGEITALHLSALELENLAAPWEMFSNALARQLRGVESIPGLQIVSMPIDADWNHPIYGNYKLWRLIGDAVPMWGPTYRPSRIRLYQAYYTFLTNLDIPLTDPTEKALAEAARERYLTAMYDLKSAFMQVSDNWKVFDEKQNILPPERQISFSDWYNLFDGSRIAQLQQTVRSAEQEFTAWFTKGYPGYGFIQNLLANFDDPVYQLSAFDEFDNVEFCRTFNAIPNVGDWISESRQGKGKGLTFNFDKLSPRTRTENTTWGGSATWLEGWFSFGDKAKGGRFGHDINFDQYQMSIRVRNYGTFQVNPTNWFDPTAIRTFKNGPFLPDGPIAKGQFKLWSPDGILPLIPNTFVLAYQPEITVRLSSEDFHKIRSNFYSNNGFSFGPFGFGPCYGRNIQDVFFDESTYTITARDTSEKPQVVAAISLVTPDLM